MGKEQNTGKQSRKEKKLEQYRIFYIKDGKKEVTTRFKAANDREAFEYLKKYRKLANKANGTYYYGDCSKYGYFDDKTKKTVYYDDIDDMHEEWLKDRNIWQKLRTEFDVFVMRLNDVKYWFIDKFFQFKHDHNRSEAWNLDNHILEDILYNVPKLIESRNGTPVEFIAKAIKKIHENDEGFNVNEYLKTHFSFTDEEQALADKMLNDEYRNLLFYVRMYYFYSDFGIIDEKDPEMVKIAKKYGSTLPYLPGRYKEFDYKKLNELTMKYWRKIWTWLSIYGHTLCD